MAAYVRQVRVSVHDYPAAYNLETAFSIRLPAFRSHDPVSAPRQSRQASAIPVQTHFFLINSNVIIRLLLWNFTNNRMCRREPGINSLPRFENNAFLLEPLAYSLYGCFSSISVREIKVTVDVCGHLVSYPESFNTIRINDGLDNLEFLLG